LHFIASTVPNQYEQALTAVGEIIQDYDSDRLFPVLGFGARLPPDGRISHEFFVNMHPTNPYCSKISGMAWRPGIYNAVCELQRKTVHSFRISVLSLHDDSVGANIVICTFKLNVKTALVFILEASEQML
jgi:hypothetical protein